MARSRTLDPRDAVPPEPAPSTACGYIARGDSLQRPCALPTGHADYHRNESTPLTTPSGVKVERSKEWWLARADAEGDSPVTAGGPVAPLTVAPARPAREAAERWLSEIAFPQTGGTWLIRDSLTELLDEHDRASRSPGPALVDCGWCGTEGIGADHKCQGVFQYGLKFVERRPLSGLDAATVEDRDPDVRPTWSELGLPLCDDACPNYDGKRCKATGFRPDRFCEPMLVQLLSEARALATPPGQAKP